MLKHFINVFAKDNLNFCLLAVYTLENEFIINSFIHYHNKFGIIKACLLDGRGDWTKYS